MNLLTGVVTWKIGLFLQDENRQAQLVVTFCFVLYLGEFLYFNEERNGVFIRRFNF